MDRYAVINGVKYGSINYNGSLLDGVYEPERFVALDKKNPYRIANGIVMDVFTNPSDDDYHVHSLVDDKYKDLLKIDFVIFPYGELLRIISKIVGHKTEYIVYKVAILLRDPFLDFHEHSCLLNTRYRYAFGI